jgi:hypothetical protein
MALHRIIRVGLVVVMLSPLVTGSASAGEEPDNNRRHSFIMGGGTAVPHSANRRYMFTAGMVRLGYGYLVLKYLQADLGLDLVFGAARVNIRQQSLIGEVRIRDTEYLMPFGMRLILPVAGMVNFFGGGGLTYLYYSEEADVPSGISFYCPFGPCSLDVACPSCTSRGGWGYYWSAGGDFALDRRRHVWLGVETRMTAGTTSGASLGALPAIRTEDRWLNTTVNLTLRF